MSDAAFDAVAQTYDQTFTQTPLARSLREVVWARLAAHFSAGDHVLELNCGTGEDAIWLAQRGITVVATDVSEVMLNVTERKAQQANVADCIETRILDIAAPLTMLGEGQGVRAAAAYDGVLSNFGGLNCARDLRPLANFLASVVKAHGTLILVPMNRWCAWEIVWHLLHLQLRTAFRRLRRDGVEASLGAGTVHVWYPSIRVLAHAFAPNFALKRATGLGIGLPPSYLEAVVARRPALFRWLQRLDRLTCEHWPFNLLADHVILEFERAA